MKTQLDQPGSVFGVYIPLPLHSKLVSRIGIDGKTRNAVVRKAIVAYLEACEPQAKTPAA